MKNIIVTGALGGMGNSTCKKLLENGYNVFALDFLDNFHSTEPEKNSHGSFAYFKVDVRDSSSINKVFEELKNQNVKIDAIVNFAGIYDLNSLVEIPEEDFIKIFDINLFGTYRINKIFLPLLSENAKIIITSSELAPLEPLPFTGLYAITKSALEKYAFSLRMELQLLGHKVCVIRSGAVKTNLLSVSTSKLDNFTQNTKLYSCNANRFKKIVDSVESKNVHPDKIASVVLKILKSKNPKYIYNINRNILLRLLNIFPAKFQCFVIKMILQ